MLISNKQRNTIVSIIIVGTFLSTLSQTVLTAALPSIMKDFNIDANLGQWLTTAYLVVLGITIPVTAYLINRFKTRNLFFTAMGLFLIGCIISIFANNFSIMIISRVIQAIGAGVLTQLVQIIMLKLYPVEERGVAMGIVGLAIGFAPAVGPTLSGFIIDNFGWRILFYILAGIALIDMIVAVFLLENVGETKSDKLDIISVALSTIGFGGLLVGVSNEGSYGWINLNTSIPLILGTIGLMIFIIRQFKLERPLLELRVFKSRNFTISIILICIIYAAMMAATILISIYVQSDRGYSAMTAGLLMLPGSVLFAILSPVTGKILDKHGARSLSIIGMIAFLIGNFSFSLLKENSSLLLLTFMFCFRMIGIAAILFTITTWGINSLKKEYVSHGAVISSTLRQSAGGVGSAILITIMSTTAKSTKFSTVTLASINGIDRSFTVASILSLITLVGIVIYVKDNKKVSLN